MGMLFALKGDSRDLRVFLINFSTFYQMQVLKGFRDRLYELLTDNLLNSDDFLHNSKLIN